MTIGRQSRYRVAVAHPHLRVFLKALEQRIFSVKLHKMRPSVLACVGLFNLSASLRGYELRPIAYSEHGKLAYKLAQVGLERLRVVHGIRRTAKDYADNARRVLRKLVVRQDFTKRVKLAHAAADELRCLRTEVENDDFLHRIFLLVIKGVKRSYRPFHSLRS